MSTPLSQLGKVASGRNSITTGDLYQQLFNQGGQLGQNAQGLASNTSGALTDTQQAIIDQNAERLSNQLASKYSGAGRYGSFGAGIGMARGISETNNPLIAQFNQANIGNALSAMGVQQGAAGLQYNAAGGLSNVQQQNIGNQMNAANSQLNTYNQGAQRALAYTAMSPSLMQAAFAPAQAQLQADQAASSSGWQGIQGYANTLQSLASYLGNAGTVTTNSNQNQQAQAQTQSNTSGTTAGSTSQPTPWTTYAGLGLAGIGALSDRRLKTDITKLGKDPHTSLNMYAFRYKGDPKTYPKVVGPMAQEVQKKYPEAVGELPGGILFIKKAA
jgi:hypothetical protein